MGLRANEAIVQMLASACEPLAKDPQLVAEMLQGAMGAINRRLLESDAPEKQFNALRDELIFVVKSYLQASTGRRLAISG
jgi:hypothetical protein